MILESLRIEEEESRVTAPRPIAEPDDDPPTHEITLRADKQQTSPPPNLTRAPASPRERDDAASAAISRGIDQAARASTASGRETDAPPTVPRSHEDVSTRPRLGPRIIEDPSRTEPSMPRFAPPPTTPPPLHPNLTLPGHAPGPPSAPWSTGLAARIDAKIDSRVDPAFEDRDEWGKETPVVAPTKAELRSLLGVPDPTRKQSLDELEALHRATTEAEDLAEPEILQRRAPSATAEVDPDDIEAAIEVAPRARQRAPSAIAVAKKPKQD